jgi:heterogeneous nuclear rnp K-like protein 2
MPEADLNRKRSRSPSDSEEQKSHKRANTGSTSNPDESHTNNASAATAQQSSTSVTHDVTMGELAASNDDTASSTPSNPERSRSVRGEGKLGDADETKPNSATTSAGPSSATSTAPAPSAMIHMRCLIVTQDASIIIGKGGSHVNEIREKSGARVMVSESIPGNPERILNVSGPLDAVSKVSICAV